MILEKHLKHVKGGERTLYGGWISFLFGTAKQLSLSSITALISTFSEFANAVLSGTGRSLNVETVACGRQSEGLRNRRKTLSMPERLSDILRDSISLQTGLDGVQRVYEARETWWMAVLEMVMRRRSLRQDWQSRKVDLELSPDLQIATQDHSLPSRISFDIPWTRSRHLIPRLQTSKRTHSHRGSIIRGIDYPQP